MSMRKERELLLQAASRQALLAARSTGVNSVSNPDGRPRHGGIRRRRQGQHHAGLAQDRPLTPTFYQWIHDLHPSIPKVNEKFRV